jgi:hypothetical protein
MDEDEGTAVITNGTFVIETTPGMMTGAALIRPAAVDSIEALSLASAMQSSTCFDMATLLPEKLPLAAPVPIPAEGEGTCGAPIVISAASTILAEDEEVTQQMMRAAFQLPEGVVVGQYNAMQVGACSGLRTLLTLLYFSQGYLLF